MVEAFVSAATLRDWRDSLERVEPGTAGGNLAVVDELLQTGIDTVELRRYVEVLETIGAASRPSALAWSAGLAVIHPFGQRLGQAILGCGSLGSALHWTCQFFPLQQDASSLRLDVDAEWTTLSYKILDPTIWPRHENAMYTLGIYAMLIQAAAPEAWGQVQITVEAEPEQVRVDLAAIVKTGVVYGGSANTIRFPTSVINAPLNLAPATDAAELKRLTAELSAKKRSMPVADRTRQMIFDQMNEGRVCQERVARELGISSRTLRRRLADENQSFQMLLDDCRMQFAALEFRTRKRLSLSDMALRLGYSEHSTFSRAFARWCGMPPQEYRRVVAG